MKPVRSEEVIRREIDALKKRHPSLKLDGSGSTAIKDLQGAELKAFKEWDLLVSELAVAVAKELRRGKRKRKPRQVRGEETQHDFRGVLEEA